MRFGCHSVLFREKIKTNTEEIISGFAKAGCDGTEMGARFFNASEKSILMPVLQRHNIQLAGMHVGVGFGEWLNKTDEVIENTIMPIARFLGDLPNKNIIMSGGNKSGETDIAGVAKAMEKGAKRCAELGVTIHYHNHAPEFENNAAVFNALAGNSELLRFGVDLGWAYSAGTDITDLLKTRKDRINYVHLRDAKSKGSNDFCNLGEGIVDYRELLSVLSDVLGDYGWAVVEYEEGEVDMNRYINAMQFLRGFGYKSP